MKLKSKKSLLFLALLVGIGSIGVTMAVFNSTGLLENVFSSQDHSVVIEEEFNNEFGTKKVTFTNTTDDDVIIRINYNEYWKSDTGYLSNYIGTQEVVTKKWVDTFATDWTYKDGWFYYNKVLKGNSGVQVLESIELNTNLFNEDNITRAAPGPDVDQFRKELYINRYNNADYNLYFNFEATQVSSDAVLELWGLQCTIDGDNITW